MSENIVKYVGGVSGQWPSEGPMHGDAAKTEIHVSVTGSRVVFLESRVRCPVLLEINRRIYPRSPSRYRLPGLHRHLQLMSRPRLRASGLWGPYPSRKGRGPQTPAAG